jgi:ACS family glucarate transporter-like MFS transporter
MAVCLAFITYLDRVCIAITAPSIMRELSLSKVQMGYVFSAFTVAYALFEIPTGWWGDKVGTRSVLMRIVVWWSTFTMATAAAFSYGSLLVVRFLFGIGEAGAWPNVAKTFSRWFPVSERGTAQGIFFMGAHLGGGVTPFLVAWLASRLGWRAVFPIFGSIGFFWAAAWYWWYRDNPAEHKSVGEAELQHIRAGQTAGGESDHRGLWSSSILFLCLMYFTQTYGFYFFITWLPTYLEKQKGLASNQLSFMTGLPMLLSIIADLSGGITTDRMTRRFGLRIGRCLVGGSSLFAAGIFVIAGAYISSPLLSGLLIAMAGASANFLLGAAWGACVDIAGNRAGVVSAFMNTAGQVGGALSPVVFALLTTGTNDWSMPLYVTGVLYLLGALCWFGVRPERAQIAPGALAAVEAGT